MVKGRSFSVLALAGSLCLFAVCGIIASAQEVQPPQTSASPAAPQSAHVREHKVDEGKLILKEEEGKADLSEVFRHSPAVRWIARVTGLSIDQTFWLCMALNFIFIFALLWFLLRKTIPAVFRNRGEAIQRRLEEARKTSEDARRRLAEIEARLGRLDTEIEQMRREADDSSGQEEQRVMAAAEEERRRIVETAQQEIARAANAARRELKAYAAELGIRLAESKIRIGENDDQELVREFAARMGRDGN